MCGDVPRAGRVAYGSYGDNTIDDICFYVLCNNNNLIYNDIEDKVLVNKLKINIKTNQISNRFNRVYRIHL